MRKLLLILVVAACSSNSTATNNPNDLSIERMRRLAPGYEVSSGPALHGISDIALFDLTKRGAESGNDRDAPGRHVALIKGSAKPLAGPAAMAEVIRRNRTDAQLLATAAAFLVARADNWLPSASKVGADERAWVQPLGIGPPRIDKGTLEFWGYDSGDMQPDLYRVRVDLASGKAESKEAASLMAARADPVVEAETLLAKNDAVNHTIALDGLVRACPRGRALLVATATSHRMFKTRSEAVSRLPACKHADNVATLSAILRNEKHEYVRVAAVFALAKLGGAAARAVLFKAQTQDASSAVRRAAKQALASWR